MARTTDVRLRAAWCDTQSFEYRSPIKFGGRVVTNATILNVRVDVETRSGAIGSGAGSMPLGNVWAWPSTRLTMEQTLAAMRTLGERLVRNAVAVSTMGHPL